MRAAQLFVAANKNREALDALSLASGYLYSTPGAALTYVVSSIPQKELLNHAHAWRLATLARVYTMPNAQWIDESRAVWRSLSPSDPLGVRAGVITNYVNATASIGLFDEAIEALEEFRQTLSPADAAIGALVIELWEIVIDVWRGYKPRYDIETSEQRLSPLINGDDANIALWAFNVTARNARTRGDRLTELVQLERAREAASRCAIPLVRALVTQDRVAGAWFWGDDAAYAQAVSELEATSGAAVWEGVRHFIACCRGQGDEPLDFGKVMFQIIGLLIAASTARDHSLAKTLVTRAAAHAEELNSAFHRVLCRVALALVEPNERARNVAEALRLAERTESAELIASVKSLSAGPTATGMLAAFTSRFCRDVGSLIVVSVLTMKVLMNGGAVKLQRRGLEVLLALALERRGLTREELSDRIWPDRETREGLRNLKVHINHLRQQLGAGAIISTQDGYVLSPDMSVDITEIERYQSTLRLSGVLEAHTIPTFEAAARANLDVLESAVAHWPWFQDTIPRLDAAVRDASIALARHGLATAHFDMAIEHSRRLFERDRTDALAAELLSSALRGTKDELAASRVLREHDKAATREFGGTR